MHIYTHEILANSEKITFHANTNQQNSDEQKITYLQTHISNKQDREPFIFSNSTLDRGLKNTTKNYNDTMSEQLFDLVFIIDDGSTNRNENIRIVDIL